MVHFLNTSEKQYSYMKKLIIAILFLFPLITILAQNEKAGVLQDLEKNQIARQVTSLTATLKSASRLFGEKNDLTSVILVIPSGSVVDVLGSDSTYLQVAYDNNEGYIYKRQAVINQPPEEQRPAVRQEEAPREQQVAVQRQESRYTRLENKYGSNLADRMISGKIWKGMTSEMVSDSWGTPQKINRVISGNIIKEQWYYRDTWLFIQDDVLVDWGPIK